MIDIILNDPKLLSYVLGTILVFIGALRAKLKVLTFILLMFTILYFGKKIVPLYQASKSQIIMQQKTND